MAYNDNKVNNSVFDDLKEKFSQLDQKQQLGALVVGAMIVFVIFSRLFGGEDQPVQQQAQQQQEQASVRKVQLNTAATVEDDFSMGGADESVIRRNFVNQTLGEFESLKEEIKAKELKELESLKSKNLDKEI